MGGNKDSEIQMEVGRQVMQSVLSSSRQSLGVTILTNDYNLIKP